MAYELHIERDRPIRLSQWQAAVAADPAVRLDTTGASIINPATGEEITLPPRPGDAEMCIDGRWMPVFRFGKGRASFRAPASTAPTDPVMAAALRLAEKLSARVRGDEGETHGTEAANGNPA